MQSLLPFGRSSIRPHITFLRQQSVFYFGPAVQQPEVFAIFIFSSAVHSLVRCAFRQIQTAIEGVYFFFSFGFLICRSIAVSIYASWINEESRQPIHFLHSLPSELYNIEVNVII